MLMTGLAPEVYENMKKQTPLGYVRGTGRDGRPGDLPGLRPRVRYIHRGSTINASGGS